MKSLRPNGELYTLLVNIYCVPIVPSQAVPYHCVKTSYTTNYYHWHQTCNLRIGPCRHEWKNDCLNATHHPGHQLFINTLTSIIAVQCILAEQLEGTYKIQMLIIDSATHAQHYWLMVNLQYMSPWNTDTFGIATNENVVIAIMMVVSHIDTIYVTHNLQGLAISL